MLKTTLDFFLGTSVAKQQGIQASYYTMHISLATASSQYDFRLQQRFHSKVLNAISHDSIFVLVDLSFPGN